MEEITDKGIKYGLTRERGRHMRDFLARRLHGQKSREPVDMEQVLALRNETNASKLAVLQHALIQGEYRVGKRSVPEAPEQPAQSPVDDVYLSENRLYIGSSNAK